MATGAKSITASGELQPNGAAVAALLSAAAATLALGVVVVASEGSPATAARVHALGKLWMPGAEGIGPYSGKETVALSAWVVSWVLLHLSLRRRDMNLGFWLCVFLVGIGVATTLIWPPVWKWIFPGH